MSVLGRIRNHRTTTEVDDPDGPARNDLSWLLGQIQHLGHTYPLGLQQTYSAGDEELPDSRFGPVVRAAYQQGGPVFACIMARAMLFSEARFQWQALERGRPGGLFGTAELRLLEQPWPRGTTGELLWRAEQDVSLGGNFYVRRYRNRLWRLRPDWVTIVLGSQLDADDPADAIDAEVAGYLFKPPQAKTPTVLMPSEVAHWSPIPDPVAHYRGMSWVTPLLREIDADNLAVTHKAQFFRRAATVNIVVLPDATVSYDEFKQFKDDFTDSHEGAWNAYKTLFLGGGSKVEKVGLSMKDMDYRGIMGVGETRIAAAAGVPPIIAGFSEGLASATYSNYGMARRKFGDHWARPQWRSFCAAIEHLLDRPAGAASGATRLWYDDRDIAFLREDQGDEAKIRQTDAITVRQLIEAGYDPDAAVEFVATGNLAALEGRHSGRVSVQLTPMAVEEGADTAPPADPPAALPPATGDDDGEGE